jgi:tripartite-type tricarboxylate transporter receptor subunit TctC
MQIWFGMADVAIVISAPGACAQAYPCMPVHIVVAFALGVATDDMTRIVAQARS